MADDVAGQLLGEDQRSSWCGDRDVTGRFVCRRIRDHALDWHAGRNDAGGIHQWKVPGADGRREDMPAAIPATNPADDPIGAVRIEHHDGGHSVWQHVGGTPGNEWMCMWSTDRRQDGNTLPPKGVAGFAVAGPVPGTPATSAVDSDPHDGDTCGDVERECQSYRDDNHQVRQLLTQHGFEVPDPHRPLAEILEPALDTLRTEMAELRASREVWALEALRLDCLADKFLTWFDQLLTAAAKATGVSPGLKTVLPALELLTTERATTQAEVARLTRERDDAQRDLDTLNAKVVQLHEELLRENPSFPSRFRPPASGSDTTTGGGTQA